MENDWVKKMEEDAHAETRAAIQKAMAEGRDPKQAMMTAAQEIQGRAKIRGMILNYVIQVISRSPGQRTMEEIQVLIDAEAQRIEGDMIADVQRVIRDASRFVAYEIGKRAGKQSGMN